MTISTVCPACQADYELPDHLRGKRVLCKVFVEEFVIEDKAAARPQTFSAGETEERDQGAEAVTKSPRPASALGISPERGRRDFDEGEEVRPAHRLPRADEE